jgi:Cu-processing system ATP-binding protein
MAGETAMIEVNSVTKRFGDVLAVDGVELRVEAGQVFGLIGHNGAGKSTLFKMMLGLVRPDAGQIRIDGEAIDGARFRDVRRTVGYLPENVAFYENLTGLETLAFFAKLKRVPLVECEPMLERVGLAAAANRRVKGYSKGMRQRLGFAQALLGNPKLLFLDEPTNGLDPEGIRDFYRVLRDMKAAGATIVLTSHILSEIQERVDHLAIMKTGRIQALGTVHSLREAMRMPIRFDLRIAANDESILRRTLAPLHVGEIRVEAGRTSVHCPRESRMAVLQALSTLGATDLQIREPSLEDVFLGYSG